MKKLFFLSWILGLVFSVAAAEQSFIPATELIENARQYDQKEISTQGELIGDVFYRGDFAWVNICDGANAIGIWLPKELTTSFSPLGDYAHKGDYAQITGKFSRVCQQHLGETDIHLTEVSKFVVITKGYEVARPVNKLKIWLAAGLFSLAAIFFFREYFLRQRIKKIES